MDNFEIPRLHHLRQQSSSQKGIFLPSMYLCSTKGATSYEKMDISKFVCGFLEMIGTCEKRSRSVLLNYLHLILEKAIHYQWPAVRSFHASISSAVKQKWLTWLDFELIRMKSKTHFSHVDLCTVASYARQSPRSQGQGKSRKARSNYCETWNNTNKRFCSITAPKYKELYLCKICSGDHAKLHCALRRFPIRLTPTD